MSDVKETAKILERVLAALRGHWPDAALERPVMYFDHGEYGLSLESIVFEQQGRPRAVPEEVEELLVNLAVRMNLDPWEDEGRVADVRGSFVVVVTATANSSQLGAIRLLREFFKMDFRRAADTYESVCRGVSYSGVVERAAFMRFVDAAVDCSLLVALGSRDLA